MIPLVLALVTTFPVTPQTTITVDVGAGDVRVVGGARRDVEVDAEHATASQEGNRIVVRSADAGSAPDRAARARITLKVPAAVSIEAIRIVDGELRIEGVDGQIAGDVRQGDIRATDVSGVVRLETGFGDVHVERPRLVAAGLLRLRAFNGNVRLKLDAHPENARILALTFNGNIESNLPLTRKESFGPKFAEATFGSGEPVVSIDSITGDITITAAGAPRR